MCIKNILYNVYVDGEKDITGPVMEWVEACHNGHICSDPIVRTRHRKILNDTKLELSGYLERTESRLGVSIDTKLLSSDRGPHKRYLTPGSSEPLNSPDSQNPIAADNHIHPTPEDNHSHSYNVDNIMGSPAIMSSVDWHVPHTGVQYPPSRPDQPSEGLNEGGMRSSLDTSSSSSIQGFALLLSEGMKRERDRIRERIQGDWDGKMRAKVEENVREAVRKAALQELQRERLIAEEVQRYIQQKRSQENGNTEEGTARREEPKKISDPGLEDSSSTSGEPAPEFDNGPSIPSVPVSAAEVSKTPLAPHSSATHQNNAMLYTPDSLADLNEGADDIPMGINGTTDFVPDPESPSIQPLGSSETGRIASSKSPATLEPKIENPPGTSFVTMSEDVALRYERQRRTAHQQVVSVAEEGPRRIEVEEKEKQREGEDEELKAAAWLAAETATTNIYPKPSATQDDTSSIQSYNDSMLDDLESLLSSSSSLGEDEQEVFVSAFADLLVRDPSVDMMIARATSDTGIGVERFRRSFSRILKAYSRDLRAVTAQHGNKKHDHQRVAAFISRKTVQTSSLVAARYKERAPKPDNSALDRVGQYLDSLDSDSSDSSSDEDEGDTEPVVAGLETFLLQGQPFRTLKWHLRSLIIPDQRVAQVKASAEHLLNFMFCNLRLQETFAAAGARVPDFSTWLRLKIRWFSCKPRDRAQGRISRDGVFEDIFTLPLSPGCRKARPKGQRLWDPAPGLFSLPRATQEAQY
ncbi:hypothetical protein DHEL01_v206846 [Diaporthe helianthi]|uniref:Uncharacterized protein n=1 Tax=Diaporthe helianthi TaxID=158607 RepID=A0A2P5HWX8_DIAHE|nr:hypothetical protein DHEL01_v206846 [Diaporthe helianthi]